MPCGAIAHTCKFIDRSDIGLPVAIHSHYHVTIIPLSYLIYWSTFVIIIMPADLEHGVLSENLKIIYLS